MRQLARQTQELLRLLGRERRLAGRRAAEARHRAERHASTPRAVRSCSGVSVAVPRTCSGGGARTAPLAGTKGRSVPLKPKLRPPPLGRRRLCRRAARLDLDLDSDGPGILERQGHVEVAAGRQGSLR